MDSEGSDYSNGVYVIPKVSALWGSASVSISKTLYTADSLETCGGPSPTPFFIEKQLFPVLVVVCNNGKKKNMKNKKSQDQQVDDTRNADYSFMWELSRYRITDSPIVTLNFTMTNTMTTVVPPPSSDQTEDFSISL